jgi:hypothetical protein
MAPGLLAPSEDDGRAQFIGGPLDPPDDPNGSRLIDGVIASCPARALSRRPQPAS